MSLVSIGRILTPKNVAIGMITTNMFCRPLITLSNPALPIDTKRYTATREFSTELFGLLNMLTFCTAVERFLPRLLTKTQITKAMGEKLKEAGWKALSESDQKLKAAVLVSSFVGALISTAIITPILNNLVLNKLLDKITGKTKTTPAPQAVAPRPFVGTLQPAANPGFAPFAAPRPVAAAPFGVPTQPVAHA